MIFIWVFVKVFHLVVRFDTSIGLQEALSPAKFWMCSGLGFGFNSRNRIERTNKHMSGSATFARIAVHILYSCSFVLSCTMYNWCTLYTQHALAVCTFRCLHSRLWGSWFPEKPFWVWDDDLYRLEHLLWLELHATCPVHPIPPSSSAPGQAGRIGNQSTVFQIPTWKRQPFILYFEASKTGRI